MTGLVRRAVLAAQQVSLLPFPHGGQHASRANALAAVRVEAAAAARRAEVLAAVARAAHPTRWQLTP